MKVVLYDQEDLDELLIFKSKVIPFKVGDIVEISSVEDLGDDAKIKNWKKGIEKQIYILAIDKAMHFNGKKVELTIYYLVRVDDKTKNFVWQGLESRFFK